MDPITVTIVVVGLGVLGAKKLNEHRKERAEERERKKQESPKQDCLTTIDSPIDK